MAKPISFVLKALLALAVTTGCMLAGSAFSSRIIEVASQPAGVGPSVDDTRAHARGEVTGIILPAQVQANAQ
ncbi:MAG: hypothetical protein AB7E47_16690 [Desulfovibrionaceae bacterium]